MKKKNNVAQKAKTASKKNALGASREDGIVARKTVKQLRNYKKFICHLLAFADEDVVIEENT